MHGGNRLEAFFRGTRDVIPENEVTAERLVEVFQQAFLAATTTEFGNVAVTMEDGLKVLVVPPQSAPIVRIVVSFGFRDNAEEIDKLRLLNELNSTITMATYSMPAPEWSSLVVEFSLPFFGGLLPQQLVRAFRLFIQCAVGGISKYDSMGLVG